MRKIFVILILFLSTNLWSIDLDSFYREVNSIRDNFGLEALEPSEPLERLATFYARKCESAGEISHSLLSNEEIFHEAHRLGVYHSKVGEVLQSGKKESLWDPHNIVMNFMGSHDHRVILLSEADEIGAGYYSSDGRYYYFTAYVGVY